MEETRRIEVQEATKQLQALGAIEYLPEEEKAQVARMLICMLVRNETPETTADTYQERVTINPKKRLHSANGGGSLDRSKRCRPAEQKRRDLLNHAGDRWPPGCL